MSLNLLFDEIKRDKIDKCLQNLYKKHKGSEHIINKEFNKLFFDNIPQDIIKQIALNLSLEDLNNLCKTSTTFNALCKEPNSYFWSQIIKKENNPYILIGAIDNYLDNVAIALIKSGHVDINSSGDDYDMNYYRYPLTVAVENQDIKMVKLLLEHKADVDVTEITHDGYDSFDNTPLTLAVENGDINMVSLLLQHKADINEVLEFEDKNPLSIAINNNDKDMLKFLLENDAETKLCSIHDEEKAVSFILESRKDITDKKLLKKYFNIREDLYKKYRY